MAKSFRRYAAAIMVLLAQCGGAQAIEAHYDCAGGTRIAAQFSPPDAANGQVTLTFDGSESSIVLPQTMSADGARYAGDGVEFWIKGSTAKLTRGGASETCATH